MIYNAGKIKHSLDLKGRKITISSPYFSQKCEYDACDNLIKNMIDKTPISYTYDDLSQLTTENDNSYRYDSLFNRIEKNDSLFKINNLNELTDLSYDFNGNQTQNEATHYAYDPLNRLMSATLGNKRVHFLYDPLGRRLSKVVMEKSASAWNEMYREYYLYDGQQEIGAINPDGTLKNLRVLGAMLHKELPATVSIEINKKIFAPTMDVQANICQLIDPVSKTIASQYEFTAFGESKREKNDNNPWRYAAKRFDPELNLIYFGERYYDPLLARWLTTDPADFLDGMNLYQYAFNNPHGYYDPDGKFIFCACVPFALLFTPAVVKICVDAVAIGIGCWGVYHGMKYTAQTVGSPYTLSESMCHDIVSDTVENKKDTAEKADSPKKKKPEQEGPGGPPGNRPDYEKRSPGYMQKQVEQGRAPRTVERVDKGRGPHEKDHVHFKDGSAMNSDGSWKHGGRELSRHESDWLKKNGWQTPEKH